MSIDLKKLMQPTLTKGNTDEVDNIIEQNQILLSIAKSIIQYRKENHMTQKQLADKLNVKQEMISKIEGGTYNPTFKQVHKISRKLTNSADLFLDILQDISKNIHLMYIDFECSNIIKFEKKEITIRYKEEKNTDYQWESIKEG